MVRDITDRMNRREEFDATKRVVLRGWPNVGKSSLWNALIGKPRAIVTDRAGTTRDYLTSRLELDGISCILVDTAGIEFETTGLVGLAAQEAAEKQTQQCDLLVLCLDGTRELNPWERAELKRTSGRPRIIVSTKGDLPVQMESIDTAIRTSARTGTGLSELREVLHNELVSCRQAQAGVIGSYSHTMPSERAAGCGIPRTCGPIGSAIFGGRVDRRGTSVCPGRTRQGRGSRLHGRLARSHFWPVLHREVGRMASP